MGFKDAVRTCLREKYATFSGRAPRSEFWWFVLFYILVMFGATFVLSFFGGTVTASSGNLVGLFAQSTGPAAIINLVIFLALLLPAVSVTVRRFHDINLSGWWYLGCILGGLIPLIGILFMLVLLVIGLIKGTAGDNNYGPNPFAEQNPADVFA